MRVRMLVVPLLLLPVVALGAARSLRPLVVSGDVAADGAGLTDLGALRGGKRFTVLARSTALLAVGTDGASQVVARSGDPLPSPLSGTIDAITAAAVASGGRIVFSARLNSTSAPTGLFRWDQQGGVVLLALDIGSVSSLAVSDTLDVAIHGTTSGVRLLPAGAQTPLVIVDRRQRLGFSGRARAFGRPALRGASTVAFSVEMSARSSAVVRWTPADGLQFVTPEDPGGSRGRRRARRAPTAIGPSGDVAYFDSPDDRVAVAVFVRGAEPFSRLVAGAGTIVEGTPLTRVVPSFLAVDGDGRIAFLADLGGTLAIVVEDPTGLRVLVRDLPPDLTALAPGLAGTGAAWIVGGILYRHDGGPRPVIDLRDVTPAGGGFAPAAAALASDGTLAVRMDRDGIYALGRDRPQPLLRTGDPVEGDGIGPVLDVLRYETDRRGALAAAVTMADGRQMLVRRDGSVLRRVLADGDPLPSGRLADVDAAATGETPFAVDGGRVVAAVGVALDEGGQRELIEVRGGRVRALREAQDGDAFDGPLVAVRGGAVVGGTVGSGETTRFGLLRVGRRAVRPVIAVGDRVPGGGGTIGAIGPVAGLDRGLVFLGGLDPAAVDAFFLWAPGRGVRRLPLPTHPTNVEILAIASDGQAIVTLEAVDDAGTTALAVRRRRGPIALATSGDPSPLGGTLDLASSEPALALARGRLAVLATLVGAPVQAAVLETTLGGRPAR